MSKLRRKPLLSSSTDAVSMKRSLSGNWNRKPVLTSVAVMRDTVGFGMPVNSASSRLLTGASEVAMRRNTAKPRARAVISSVVASRSRGMAWALERVVTEISLFRNLISDFYQL
nr:hypothetical protein [Burkholderia mallei]